MFSLAAHLLFPRPTNKGCHSDARFSALHGIFSEVRGPCVTCSDRHAYFHEWSRPALPVDCSQVAPTGSIVHFRLESGTHRAVL